MLEKSNAEEKILNSKISQSEYLMPDSINELLAGKHPTLGDPEAPVKLVIFSDFECPFCRHLAEELNQLTPAQLHDVYIVFHHFPLSFHKFAHSHAMVAACAAQQGNDSFWDVYRYLYGRIQGHQETTDDVLKEIKDRKGIDTDALSVCVHGETVNKVIETDIALGEKYGVRGTPTMFLNGKRISGVPQNLQHLIHEAASQQLY